MNFLSKRFLEMELVKFLNDYQITYRDSLNLPKNLTFGIEIEEVGVKFQRLNELLFDSNWCICPETSIQKNYGAEVSSPIFIDEPQTWQEIFKICEFLKKNNATVSEETAAHIHFGNSGIIDNDPNKLLNIMKMWGAYEKIIYRFSKGQFPQIREGVYKFAKPIAKEIKNITLKKGIEDEPLEKLLEQLYFRRHCGLNIENMYYYYKLIDEVSADDKKGAYELKDTIEVRTPNGTLEPTIWQNNINFFSKLLLYAASDNFDSEKIDDMLKNMEFTLGVKNKQIVNYTYLDYMTIDIPLAIELANTIFKDEVDKLNFLKQYLENDMEEEKTLVLR